MAEQPGNANRLYRALGVEPGAGASDIKKAYHRAALKYHPDKNPLAGERFNEIASAYALLSDPRKRQLYVRRPGPSQACLRLPSGAPSSQCHKAAELGR